MPFAYITCPNKEEAKKLAKHLLEKRLIGCANIFPIESMYWFNEAIEEETETVLIAKTTEDMFETMRDAVLDVHPYAVPCVTRIEAAPNSSYEKWLKASCGRPA